MTVAKAEKRLLDVAKKYGYSMTRLPADEHRPKDRPFRMSLAKAYLAYERAQAQSACTSTGAKK